jgi:hypothetical protein
MARTRLRAGTAKVDITPDLTKIRIQLGGYNARLNMPPTGVHDPIYARALAVEMGGQSAVMVALDHLLVPHSLTRAVLQATGLQPAQLFSGREPHALRARFERAERADALPAARRGHIFARVSCVHGGSRVAAGNTGRRASACAPETLALARRRVAEPEPQSGAAGRLLESAQ